ncbi:hypothetical protein MOV66_30030 [Agrobacterium sp. SHOUNA12C]|uniref:hypothetical protein n=1 Tax=Rhizobium rhizogenes TaxID=359 RepID=UPI00115DF798|nr:hypothetical protein [Rhizobium rhizogenes]KAA6475465.1 hypothetical protein DXT98_29785 [Agrobacterium sp. ICMP 7243]MCJ9725060.1 hypothetical protein [Agrobacterium sp. BETTINA12B]MCJ9760912.1 hypothetical protein [Agrobacterium sp. SHOUNA12C]NTF46680.1 hypothetical protein [Rhizobium rhizogenes]NTF53274.1 hypothetical protein [Rhizobium rhizogenes]
MLSESKFFEKLIETLVSQELISIVEIESSLEEFGGIKGTISEKYYISACEILAWTIAKTRNSKDICSFISNNGEILTEHSEFMYYFVQGLVDQLSALGNEPAPIIALAPERYQVFLKRRFLGTQF